MKIKRNYEEKAFEVWNILTKSDKIITYKNLGELINENHLIIGRILEPIQEYCKKKKLPPLTILVINKKTGRPGKGFIAWDLDKFEEGVKKVQDYDWSNINNPF